MSAPRGRRTRLRTGLLLALVVVGSTVSACGGQPGGQEHTSSDAGAAVPGAQALRDEDASGTAADQEHEGGEEAPASTGAPVAGSNAPPGFVELRGDGEELHAAMTDGAGTAEPLLLTDPPLPAGWQVVEPDGPMFVQTVCGVQLDPVQPRDAAHRRWGLVADFTYLTSEVHLFAEPEGQGLAGDVATALQDCAGYGVDEDGREVPLGSGVHQVDVTRLAGLPEPWVGWTETTEDAGLVRHNALRDVDGGWHWVSLVASLGTPAEAELLVDTLEGRG